MPAIIAVGIKEIQAVSDAIEIRSIVYLLLLRVLLLGMLFKTTSPNTVSHKAGYCWNDSIRAFLSIFLFRLLCFRVVFEIP